jgi:UDP-N-acetylmuramoyl-tripeptide--D-alanyl-D-alanine ligase
MIHACLSDLAAAFGLRLNGADAEIAGVSTDTRSLKAGNLYVALKGERVDGHDFVAAAKAAGASAALVEHAVGVDLPQLAVRHTEVALGDIARRWRLCCAARVVGITGSNGKTTVKSLTHEILSRAGTCHTTQGNLNNEVGLPLTLCALPDDYRYAVIEMGAGKPGDIEYLANIAHPDVALVNNVAPAHLERMLSVQGVAATKGAIYTTLSDQGIAVINAEDAFASYFVGLAGARRIFRFGLVDAADIRGRVISATGTSQRLAITTPLGDIEVQLPLPGLHNARNALAATALALGAGAALSHVQSGLEAATAVNGRLKQHRLANGATVIDDSYNANPGSIRAAIDTLADIGGERWLVLGDIAELGSDSATLHHGVGAYARERGIDRLLAVGPRSLDTCKGYGDRAEHFPNQAALIETLQGGLGVGITVLIKGSRSSAMDRVVSGLLGAASGDKTHAA